MLSLCQNAGFTLLRRYSQAVKKESYSYSSLLLVGEIVKLTVSAYMTGWGSGREEDTDIKALDGVSKLVWLAKNCQKMLIIAGIYAVMNLLSFVSLARIDAVEFTVASQLKILATACFFVVMFKRKISATKWRALVLLVCGTILVSNPSAMGRTNGSGDGNGSDTVGTNAGNKFIGYTAVLAQVAMSGFAAVYFEKVCSCFFVCVCVCVVVFVYLTFLVLLDVLLGLSHFLFKKVIKSSTEKLSIWDRNVQLAGCSIAFYFVTFVGEAFTATEEDAKVLYQFSLSTFLSTPHVHIL